ncbi:MAG: MCE family protein [Desulfobacula sp.]|nr:MCE family protein [Desulfobacula sp.]
MNKIEEPEIKSAALPHAIIQKKKGISIVWIIPLVAIIIAAGLVYKALGEKGPVITISFKSAKGLEAGKTKVKYKDVVIGEIEAIKVSPDLKGVIVTAKLVKDAQGYLSDTTKFWVVRARLAGGNVSGIGTLFSGSYIAIDPGREGKSKNNFKGLEEPPVITSDLPGSYFQLKSPQLGSLEYGSPIYFKGIKVGKVVGYHFSGQKKDLDIKIFIDSPYDQNVFHTTRFWFASGLDIVLDTKGVRIETQSFVSMLIGGLAFGNPEQQKQGSPASEGHIFPLYDSSEDAMAMRYAHKEYYLLKFHNSVRGLSIGAPVEFRGFPIGQVVNIGLEADWDHNQIKIPVKIEVEPERIKQLLQNTNEPGNALEMMVKKGMRAQLKTGNLITGSMYVAIDFFKAITPASIVKHDGIIEIPTIPAALDEWTSNLTSILDKLSKIPLEEIGSAALETIYSLDKTSRTFEKAGEGINELVSSETLKKAVKSLNISLAQIQRLTYELEQNLPSAVDSMSQKTIAALDGIEELTDSDSAIIFELKQTLKEFAKSAQAIGRLADYLEQHPESIIQGKAEE